MQSTLPSGGPEMFPGLELLKEEHVLLSGFAWKRLRNPLQPDRKHRNGFVLTNIRLIMHSKLWSFFGAKGISGANTSNLTAMPLTEIECVQVLDVR